MYIYLFLFKKKGIFMSTLSTICYYYLLDDTSEVKNTFFFFHINFSILYNYLTSFFHIEMLGFSPYEWKFADVNEKFGWALAQKWQCTWKKQWRPILPMFCVRIFGGDNKGTRCLRTVWVLNDHTVCLVSI